MFIVLSGFPVRHSDAEEQMAKVWVTPWANAATWHQESPLTVAFHFQGLWEVWWMPTMNSDHLG